MPWPCSKLLDARAKHSDHEFAYAIHSAPHHRPFPDCFGGIDRLFHGDIDPKSVAAIVIEPVQGEGGFNVAPFDFLRTLRRVCVGQTQDLSIFAEAIV